MLNVKSEAHRRAALQQQLALLSESEVDLQIMLADEGLPMLARQSIAYVLAALIDGEMSVRDENQE